MSSVVTIRPIDVMGTLTKARKRFKEFGGMRLVREYARMGVLGTAVKAAGRAVFKKESLRTAYAAVLRKVAPQLEARYGAFMKRRLKEYCAAAPSPEASGKVWVCWLQGMGNAPELVRACFRSLQTNLPDREIVLLDSTNISDYVEIPEHVQRKWEEGKIPAASYSDIVRLSLLSVYGGTWIDATVLCTGGAIPQEYMDADLFLFQYTRPGTDDFHGISTWFISAHAHHPVIMAWRDMLCEYWRDFDCLVDYYVIHHFFIMLMGEHPRLLKEMPYGYSRYSLSLLDHLGDTFKPESWRKLTARTSFHKLTCRAQKATASAPDSYYTYIVNHFLYAPDMTSRKIYV